MRSKSTRTLFLYRARPIPSHNCDFMSTFCKYLELLFSHGFSPNVVISLVDDGGVLGKNNTKAMKEFLTHIPLFALLLTQYGLRNYASSHLAQLSRLQIIRVLQSCTLHHRRAMLHLQRPCLDKADSNKTTWRQGETRETILISKA